MRSKVWGRFWAVLLAVILFSQSGWGIADTWALGQELYGQGTPIDEENFPDRIFRKYVADTFDLDGNGILDTEEKESVCELDVSGRGIRSLRGISVFGGLRKIQCRGDRLTGLDLRACGYLESLDADWNQIREEDLLLPDHLQGAGSAGVSLEFNAVPDALQLEKEEELVEITEEIFPDAHFRKYIGECLDLDLDGRLSWQERSQVTTLYLKGMGIECLEGLEYFPCLVYLNCENGRLAELDLNGNPLVESVYCRDNLLSVIDARACMQLQEISSDGDVAVWRSLGGTQGQISGNDIPEDGIQGDTISENSTSENSISENSASENIYPGTDVSGNDISENKVSGNDISGNDISGNDLSGNGVSGNSASGNSTPEKRGRTTTSGTDTPAQDPGTQAVATYTVTFKPKGGSAVKAQKIAKGGKVKKPADPVRSRYLFKKWYNGNKKYDFKKTVTKDLTLTAKWSKVSVARGDIRSLANKSKGVLKVTYAKVKGAHGYQLQVSTDKSFNSKKESYAADSTTFSIKDRYKNKTYYVRVRAYKLDSRGKKIYGKFSVKKKLKIAKGIQTVAPSRDAATLTSVALASKKNVRVRAKITDPVKSVDAYYYLFHLQGTGEKIAKKAAPDAKVKKSTTVTMTTPLARDTSASKLQSKFVLAVKTGKEGTYTIISAPQYISNAEKAASYNYAFPTAVTKKGLQVDPRYMEDAVTLGVKHTAYNICLDDLIATPDQKNDIQGISYRYNGSTYWFNRGIVESIDHTLDRFQEEDMLVSAILLLRWREDIAYLIPKAARESGHDFYAMDTSEAKARKHLEAVFTFLAQRYASDKRVINWILGNEVNNYGVYHYTGDTAVDKNAKIYAATYRTAHIAMRSVYAKARVYISLDQTWTYLAPNSNSSKQFLDRFAEYWASYGKLGDFNIAFHPYPAPLEDPAFWTNSKSLISNSVGTPCIAMSNLTVLTNYVKMRWGSNTRIILSEQGFTSSRYGVEAEELQAAAIAYAYYLAEFNDMIDAFILHRHVDHQAEQAIGLALGLWTNDGSAQPASIGKKKYAWEVFRYMDTSKGSAKTKFALARIGTSSWKAVVPGYTTARFS